MSKKYDLLTFEDFFMNFLLELKFLILSHPVTSKQPHEIVQIHMHHPVLMSVSKKMDILYIGGNLYKVYSFYRNRLYDSEKIEFCRL